MHNIKECPGKKTHGGNVLKQCLYLFGCAGASCKNPHMINLKTASNLVVKGIDPCGQYDTFQGNIQSACLPLFGFKA